MFTICYILTVTGICATSKCAVIMKHKTKIFYWQCELTMQIYLLTFQHPLPPHTITILLKYKTSPYNDFQI